MSEVATTVWMRGFVAYFTASQHRSMSPRATRESPQMLGAPSSVPICRATSRVASKSSSEEIGKPASMTSTRRRASCRAISSFSTAFMEKPGDCSPSRNVVSKMITRSMTTSLNLDGPWPSTVSDFLRGGGLRKRRASHDETAHGTGERVAREEDEEEELRVRRDDHDAEHDDEERLRGMALRPAELLEAPV